MGDVNVTRRCAYQHCGREFTPVRDAEFCSQKCYKAAWKASKRLQERLRRSEARSAMHMDFDGRTAGQPREGFGKRPAKVEKDPDLPWSGFPSMNPDHLLTTKQFCEELNISPMTLRRHIQRGTIAEPRHFGRSLLWTQDDLATARQALTEFYRERSRLFDFACDPSGVLRGGVPATATNVLSGRTQMIDLEQLASILNVGVSYLRDFLAGDRVPRLRPDCKAGGKLQFSMATVVEWLRAVRARRWAQSVVEGE